MLTLSGVNGRSQTLQEGNAEFHDLGDTDLFKIFLNDDEMAKSSPDSSQSGPISPESEFDSPPSTPPSPFPYGLKPENQNESPMSITGSALWDVNIKQEPKDTDACLLSPSQLEFSHGEGSDFDLKRAPFALSREDLLKLSSKSLETYAQNLAASRPLTEDEERQLKRQRRLIKNRESAQLSRQRKRLYIEELESKVSGLQADNNELMKQVSCLTSENQSLKEEMFHLQNFIKQSPILVASGAQAARRTNNSPATNLSSPHPVGAVIPAGVSSMGVKLEKEVRMEEKTQEEKGIHHEGVPKEGRKDTADPTENNESSTVQYLLSHPEELKKIIGQKDKKGSPQGKKRKKGENEVEEKGRNSQAYILCSEAHEIKATEKKGTRTAKSCPEKSTADQPVVSFLPPSTSINNLFLSLQPKDKPTPATPVATKATPENAPAAPNTLNLDCGSSLIELSCQILETKAHPIALSSKGERAIST